MIKGAKGPPVKSLVVTIFGRFSAGGNSMMAGNKGPPKVKSLVVTIFGRFSAGGNTMMEGNKGPPKVKSLVVITCSLLDSPRRKDAVFSCTR
jgi:hypothetical protein